MDINTLIQTFSSTPGFGVVVAFVALALVFKMFRRPRGPASARRTLRAIRRAPLHAAPVLNLSERKVHRHLSELVRQSRTHVLLAQVSMGEFLRVDAKRTTHSEWQTVFNTFNAKRVDFLIVDADWRPWVVVEYQGKGHAQGNADVRDAIKRAVCARADIALIEVAAAGLTPAQVCDLQDLLAASPRIAAE